MTRNDFVVGLVIDSVPVKSQWPVVRNIRMVWGHRSKFVKSKYGGVLVGTRALSLTRPRNAMPCHAMQCHAVAARALGQFVATLVPASPSTEMV